MPPYISHGLYGAGLELTFYRWGHQLVGHSGGVTGFASEYFLPAHRFGVVTMSNFKNGVVGNYISEIIVRELIDELLQIPQAVRPVWEAYVDERSGDDPEATEAKLRDELLSSLQAPSTDADARYAPEPPTTPLKSHMGKYWNAGYHKIVI